MGVMIESNLVAGRQEVQPGKALTYGQSITDGCIDFDTTVASLEQLADAVAARSGAHGGARCRRSGTNRRGAGSCRASLLSSRGRCS
jgi:3-deoxy-7-phosphoheptulonate synthase